MLLRNVQLAPTMVAILIEAALHQIPGHLSAQFAATATPRGFRMRPLPMKRKV
jgi:hypothetical protein